MNECDKSTFSRPVRLEDFLDNSEPIKSNNKSYNDVIITKNQKHYGHRKRIKP
jgi:hypothetical protein